MPLAIGTDIVLAVIDYIKGEWNTYKSFWIE